MKRRQRNRDLHDEDMAAAIKNKDPHPEIQPPDSPSPSSSSPPLPPLAMPPSTSASALLALASPATRRSISMGDFRRVTGGSVSGLRSAFHLGHGPLLQAARRRLLEVEERQRVIREMERRLEELREVFVRSEEEVVVHGELVSRITTAAQQGELYVAENGQRLKKGLKFKKHRPTIVFSSMLGLRTCLPWPGCLFLGAGRLWQRGRHSILALRLFVKKQKRAWRWWFFCQSVLLSKKNERIFFCR
uniref:Si:ch211-160f23.7 n=1 Tax=Labrus bergylta TaxID=56723 RepID=A0A3Q3L9D0_9LABR